MKKNLRVSILALILSLCMLVLCACGGETKATEETAATEAPVEETAAPASTETPAPTEAPEGWGSVPYVENDTAVKGEYTPYQPVEEADTYSGDAIEGNDEEELQQERIAGGSVGEATSQVDELHGITDYSEGDYVPVYGIDGD